MPFWARILSKIAPKVQRRHCGHDKLPSATVLSPAVNCDNAHSANGKFTAIPRNASELPLNSGPALSIFSPLPSRAAFVDGIPMKRLAVLLFAFVAIVGLARPAAATDQQRALVQSMSDEVIILLSDKSLDEQGRLTGLRGLFAKYMDLPYVGKFVLGRHWRTLDSATQARYSQAFEDYVVNIYAKRLKDYSGETIHVNGARGVNNDQHTLVSTEIRRTAGPPVSLEWRVRGDKVIDVKVEGVSMVITQRDDFNSYLLNHSIDDLIARLKQESPS